MRVGMVPADARQRSVGEAFERLGHTVEWLDAPRVLDLVVLPMPISADGVHLLGGQPMEEWFAAFRGKTLYAGRCSAVARAMAERYDLRLRDHFEREEEMVLNVIPTVEGALQWAMERTDFTLHGSATLVCGFGRIGKLLAHHLQAWGSRVTVCARRQEHFAWCKTLGYDWFPMSALADRVQAYPLIFNTVPAPIFRRRELDRMDPKCLLIDLASAPGGVTEEDPRVLQALGLPAKVAPRTAGEIICNTIMTMYQEEENTRDR